MSLLLLFAVCNSNRSEKKELQNGRLHLVRKGLANVSFYWSELGRLHLALSAIMILLEFVGNLTACLPLVFANTFIGVNWAACI
jgi:hypothetical protein